MEKIKEIPELAKASRVWLTAAEKSNMIYVVWQETMGRLSYSRASGAAENPVFVELSSVIDVQAHSKYLFAAAQNALVFWTPGSKHGQTTATASVFFELPEESTLRSFCFLRRQGRFALLWTPGGQRKAFVTLIDKKANVLAQTEVGPFGKYDVSFLGIGEDRLFQLVGSSEQLFASLPDGALWSAKLLDQANSLNNFERRAQLRSPAVLILDRGNDELHCICCLGDFSVLRTRSSTSQSGSASSVVAGNVRILRCGFPVVRAFPAGTAILAMGLINRALLTIDRNSSGDISLLVRLVDLPTFMSATEDAIDKDKLYIASSSGCITSYVTPMMSETNSQPQSPLSKLRRLADPAEEGAVELLAEIENLETQMALAMYLKFGAIDVKCDISQEHHPSLIQDNIVSCKLSATENFIASMWNVSMSLGPTGSNVRCTRSTPFERRGTQLSVQLECPTQPVCSVIVHLILIHRLLPRALPIEVQRKNVCLRSSRGSPASCSLIVHQPLIECVFNDDIKRALERLVDPATQVSVHPLPKLPNLYSVVVQGTSRIHLLGQRALLLLAMMNNSRLPIEPRLLPNESITGNIRTAQCELQQCTTAEQVLAFHEKWRNHVTFKLPLL